MPPRICNRPSKGFSKQPKLLPPPVSGGPYPKAIRSRAIYFDRAPNGVRFALTPRLCYVELRAFIAEETLYFQDTIHE